MRFRYQAQGETYEVAIERLESGLQASVNGVAYPVEILDESPGEISLRFDGVPLTLYWATDGVVRWISMHGCTYTLEKPAGRGASAASPAGAGASVRAPMPAQVRAVEIALGEQVENGQTLMLLEAMKMEIRIQAPARGRVRRLLVEPGDSVEINEILVELEYGGEQEAAGI